MTVSKSRARLHLGYPPANLPPPVGFEKRVWESLYDGDEVHFYTPEGQFIGPFIVSRAGDRWIKWPYGRSFQAPKASSPCVRVALPATTRGSRPAIDRSKIQLKSSRYSPSFLNPKPQPTSTETPEWQRTTTFKNDGNAIY